MKLSLLWSSSARLRRDLWLAAPAALIVACATTETPGTPDPATFADAGGNAPLSPPPPAATIDGGPTDGTVPPPEPVGECGDGKVNSGEQCDDGNNADGDGCTKACKRESAGANDVCPGVEIPLTGTGEETRKGSVSTTTAQTFGHYFSSCGGATGKDAVYFVKPNVTGLLTARVTSNFDSILFARRTCEDTKTQAACNDGPGTTGGDIIKLPVTKDEPVYLFVDGYSGSSGTFTLDVEVATAFCGNGIAEAPEACDDGNTKPGDGCAADCSFEAGGDLTDCPGQPIALSGTGTAPRKVSLTGTTATLPASTLTASSCSSSGPNAVYAINSDVDGSMTARLVAAYEGATLHLRTECDTGNSETQLDCREASTEFEPLEIVVPIMAGIPNFVVVDSSSSSKKGTYTLDVSVQPGTCGNDVLEGSEQCDDGNTTNGDGCTSACRLEPIAAAVDTCPGIPLTLTAVSAGAYAGVVTSSTATLASNYKPQASGNLCSTSVAGKDAVFAVTSPINGLLTATVSGTFDAAIYARTWCGPDDDTDEKDLACTGAEDGNSPETIKVPIVANTPVYVIVDGEQIAATGVFKLNATVTPAVCGNGVLEGSEQCDDGNAVANDGCSSTCQLEAPTSHDTCANAEAITLAPSSGGTFTGTVVSGTTNLSHDQAFRGCTSAGPDAIYTVVAPIDGVLTAEVPVATFNVVLGARAAGTCPTNTDATTPIVCSNVSSENGLEEISFSVVQGQMYYLIVDSNAAANKGTFTMLLNVRPPGCGDGLTSGTEECDDGNTTDGDGCSATCKMQQLAGLDTCPGYALPLTGSGTGPHTGVITIDTASLVPNYAGTCGGNAKDGVVVVTPPIDGTITAKLTGIDYEPVFYARTSCNDPKTQTVCDDDQPNASTPSRDLTIRGAKAGTPYYLFIDGYNGGSGKARLNVTVTP